MADKGPSFVASVAALFAPIRENRKISYFEITEVSCNQYVENAVAVAPVTSQLGLKKGDLPAPGYFVNFAYTYDDLTWPRLTLVRIRRVYSNIHLSRCPIQLPVFNQVINASETYCQEV